MNEFLNDFLQHTEGKNNGSFDYQGWQVDFELGDDFARLDMHVKNSEIDEFRAKLDNVDNDIFIEACKLFKETGHDVNKFSRTLEVAKDPKLVEDEIREFSQCVNAVITKEICKLKNMKM